MGGPTLDRTRAYRRGPRKLAGGRPNQEQQHMVRYTVLYQQTKMSGHSNIICLHVKHFFCGDRSLGVTVWELFELGNQPYRQYSDRQVLTYVVKEQQLKLPKPQIQFPLAERW